ncbi:MAG: hypothetical protein ACRDVO_05295 [Jiangellaceae bacterium]
MRARMGAAAGLALAGLMLASCSDEDVPGTLPDVTPTTDGPQETTSATPTGDPTAALEAEITAFFEEYAQMINQSWTSVEALARRREMFADSCESCLAGYEFAERAHAENLQIEGGAASLVRARVDRVEGDLVTTSAFTNSAAGRLLDSGGNVVQQFDASENTQITYQIRRAIPNDWIILASEVLS